MDGGVGVLAEAADFGLGDGDKDCFGDCVPCGVHLGAGGLAVDGFFVPEFVGAVVMGFRLGFELYSSWKWLVSVRGLSV